MIIGYPEYRTQQETQRRIIGTDYKNLDCPIAIDRARGIILTREGLEIVKQERRRIPLP